MLLLVLLPLLLLLLLLHAACRVETWVSFVLLRASEFGTYRLSRQQQQQAQQQQQQQQAQQQQQRQQQQQQQQEEETDDLAAIVSRADSLTREWRVIAAALVRVAEVRRCLLFLLCLFFCLFHFICLSLGLFTPPPYVSVSLCGSLQRNQQQQGCLVVLLSLLCLLLDVYRHPNGQSGLGAASAGDAGDSSEQQTVRSAASDSSLRMPSP